MYGWGRYAGFGTLDYYGLLAQANLENCSPMDSACVSNNVAKQAAVEDLWVTKYMKTGAPDDLQLTFTPQTAGQVNEFYSGSDPYNSGNVVDTRGILSYDTASSDPVRYVPPSEPSFKAALPVAPAKTVNPAGKSIINSSGPSAAFTEVFQPGGAASSIPWWGWLAGAGVAVFALKGAR